MEIKFHIYLKVIGAGISDLLELFLKFSRMDKVYLGVFSDWFLTADSKKGALQQCIIRQGELTDDASYLLGRALKSFPGVAKGIWSDSGSRIDLRNYICSDLDNYWVRFTLPESEEAKNIMRVIFEMISVLDPHIITLETNEYSLNKRQVFPDRIPVGWLMYIDHVYGEGAFGLEDRAVSITKQEQPIGTLFLCKKGLFDGQMEKDIKDANDLEILLASNNVLPLYKDIF